MSLAMSITDRVTLCFFFAQDVPPNFESGGELLAAPTYFCTR